MSQQKVEVEPSVVLSAIRYGLTRATSCYDESLALIREHADALAQWETSVLDDLRASIESPHPLRVAEETARARELLTWLTDDLGWVSIRLPGTPPQRNVLTNTNREAHPCPTSSS